MRSLAFGAACAVILLSSAWPVAAADYIPPRAGSVCDTLSRAFIDDMGLGKGFRAKVNADLSTDERDQWYVSFRLAAESKAKLNGVTVKLEDIDPVDKESSIFSASDYAKLYTEKMQMTGLMEMANDNGAWLVVVPQHDVYYAQVVFQTERPKAICLPAYLNPFVMTREEVPLELVN